MRRINNLSAKRMRNAVSQQHLLNALTAKKHREGPRDGSGQNYIGCRVTRSLTTNLSSPRTGRDERAEPARVSECRRECLVDIKLSSAEPSRAGPGRAGPCGGGRCRRRTTFSIYHSVGTRCWRLIFNNEIDLDKLFSH